MAGDPESIIRPVTNTLRWLVAATVLLYIAIAVVAVISFHNAQVAQDSLCSLRGDLENRVATSKKFLREHPEGIAGIPAETIQEGIDNQERTIEALSDLSCS